MCNTRSNVCLQSMKTCILSVNTLMWNLTSERHDNCAPCLGLILPIWWVTPPPNSSLRSVSHMALHLQSLHFLFVFNVNMSSCLSSTYWFGFCPLQHSFIAMASCLNLSWSKWMWLDPNPFYASTSVSIYPNHMHSIETVDCLLWVLVSRRQSDKCLNLF